MLCRSQGEAYLPIIMLFIVVRSYQFPSEMNLDGRMNCFGRASKYHSKASCNTLFSKMSSAFLESQMYRILHPAVARININSKCLWYSDQLVSYRQQLYQSLLLSGRNVRWARSMLPTDESR